jgi:hypothetical protein
MDAGGHGSYYDQSLEIQEAIRSFQYKRHVRSPKISGVDPDPRVHYPEIMAPHDQRRQKFFPERKRIVNFILTDDSFSKRIS